MAYDWTRPGDADTVVEDIERLDLDFFEWHSGDVMEEWFSISDEVGWAGWRQQYVAIVIYRLFVPTALIISYFSVTQKLDARLYAFGGIQTHEVGELYVNPRDAGHFMHVMRKEVLRLDTYFRYQ